MKNILSYTTKWMNFKDIMLSETNLPHKKLTNTVYFYWCKVSKLIELIGAK